jgi:acyl-CoA thioester hydrolase
MKFEYTIYDEEEKHIRAKGYSKHAFVDKSGRIIRPPGFIAEMIKKNSGS